MDMQTFFSEITALCRNEQFLHSVMEKYHYDPEEYPNLKRLAGEMIPCLETEAGWQDREIQETFPGRDQSFLAVGITLGKGIDELQEKYLQNGFLTESYMIEVLSSELLLESYRAYTEWLVVLRLANLPMLLQELALPVTCNAAYCMIPKKSVVFYAELTKDPFTKCAGICLGCGRRDCPNRMEEKENFPLRFADMTDRPLSYGYARIFSKADVK